MILFKEAALAEATDCPYLPNLQSQNLYFLAKSVDNEEFDQLMEQGWRRFAYYYFKPQCPSCNSCTPIRIPSHDFVRSKSQKRLWKKNKEVTVTFEPKRYRPEIFDIYNNHNQRFENNTSESEQDFINTHYQDTCESLQSEFYIDGILVAVGFLDIGVNSLSSSYFIYLTEYEHYSLGNFGVLAELEFCKQQEIPYYYLGYHVKDNQSMAYKSKFYPQQKYNWSTQTWQHFEKSKLIVSA